MKQLIRRLSRSADSSSSSAPKMKDPLLRSQRRREEPVPEGHVPVYVGPELERFVVRAELLGRPAVLELLRWSAMEYGYDQRGVLRIPCTADLFRRALDVAACGAGLAVEPLGVIGGGGGEGSIGYCCS